MYLDDIILMGRTFNVHLKNLAEDTSRTCSTKIRKCEFFQTQVKYLGHLVTADFLSTDENKI